MWADGMGGVRGLEVGPGIGGWYAGERLGGEVEEGDGDGDVKQEEEEVGDGEITPADENVGEDVDAETGTKKRARQSQGKQAAAKSKRRR